MTCKNVWISSLLTKAVLAPGDFLLFFFESNPHLILCQSAQSVARVSSEACHWLRCHSVAQRVNDKTTATHGLFHVMVFCTFVRYYVSILNFFSKCLFTLGKKKIKNRSYTLYEKKWLYENIYIFSWHHVLCVNMKNFRVVKVSNWYNIVAFSCFRGILLRYWWKCQWKEKKCLIKLYLIQSLVLFAPPTSHEMLFQIYTFI